MKVRLLFFGYLSELTGMGEHLLDVDGGTKVSEAVAMAKERFPQLRTMDRSVRHALNAEYCPDDAALAEGDTISFIPPVSGG